MTQDMKQLRTKLYGYQKQGIKGLEKFNGRALLADEMGLGKTIQAIVWAWRAQAFPAIVVCPASLKINWQREIRQHLGLDAEVLNGRTPPDNGQLLAILFPIWQYGAVVMVSINRWITLCKCRPY